MIEKGFEVLNKVKNRIVKDAGKIEFSADERLGAERTVHGDSECECA